MARSKNPATDDTDWRRPGGATIGDRIAAFAMLDGMGSASQAQKCLRLALVGFTNAEIAEMLQTTPAVVGQNLYTERKKPRAAPKAARK